MSRSFATGTAVVIYLHSPREKLFGVLLSLQPAGIVLRGIDLAAFEDWLRQEARGEGPGLGLSTLFFPMNRVERMELDETLGGIESLSERFLAATGKTVTEMAGLAVRRLAARRAVPSGRRRGNARGAISSRRTLR